MFDLTTHSTHLFYGYMASDNERGNPLPQYMGYTFLLAARDILYAPSHRQDSIYHDFCYTSRGALAATTNNPMGPP